MSQHVFPSPTIYNPSLASTLIPQITSIHRTCVLKDHQVLQFLPDSNNSISQSALEAYWAELLNHTYSDGRGKRVAILQMTEPTTDNPGGDLAGIVLLDMPYSETGPFRAWVKKLMVSGRHRRMGVAMRLMGKVDEVARSEGRSLLMLDTPVGTEIEREKVFEKFGYVECGVIPGYSISPKDGSLVGEKFFYKQLS